MISESEILIRIIVAAILGAAVGLERKVSKGSSAGMRTHALVCLGSCLFTVLGFVFGAENADPLRIASGIVTGVGFLGAGVIFKTENRVQGLTTAANLWAISAIGLTIGLGYYFVAIACTLVILTILVLGKRFEEEVVEMRSKKSSLFWD